YHFRQGPEPHHPHRWDPRNLAVGLRAGDRIRTGDVQLGNLAAQSRRIGPEQLTLSYLTASRRGLQGRTYACQHSRNAAEIPGIRNEIGRNWEDGGCPVVGQVAGSGDRGRPATSPAPRRTVARCPRT